MENTADFIKPLTNRELLRNIAAATGLSKKQVATVLEALTVEVKKSLGNEGPGMIKIHDLMRITIRRIPARAARTGVPNPFKPGTLRDIAAKPAYSKIKVRTLKLLREMAKS